LKGTKGATVMMKRKRERHAGTFMLAFLDAKK
jgi:hypothetical protein